MSSSSSSSSRSASPEPQIDKKLKRKRKGVGKNVVEDVAEEVGNHSDGSGANDSGEDEETKEESEEPVLSHADRRRQKKEAKLAAQQEVLEGESALKKRKLKDGTAKSMESALTMKRQHSVWVGNMSFKTQQDNLRAFFNDVGEVTRINMPTKPPAGPGMKPENRGFAYVDFASAEGKTAAIALSEQHLLGRKLLIKDGSDFAGRPAAIAGEHTINDPVLALKTHSKTAQKILRAQKQPPAPTLFFGNLGFDTTDNTIRELLEAHRPGNKKGKGAPATGEEGEGDKKPKDVWIRKFRMGTFEDTGACKGFAFVDFMTVEHATSALINPKNHHLNGRNLVVEYASAEAVRRGAPKGKGGGDGVFKGKRPFRTDRDWTARPLRNSDEQLQPENAETQSIDATTAVEEPEKRPWEHKERIFSNTEGSRHKGPKSRPKPGAALALAKRESTAIVPSEGHKITF